MNSGPVVVVGAGISGVMAARECRRAGVPVVLIDKGRRLGGRMATRRLDTNELIDHGCQFLTFPNSATEAWRRDWLERGWIVPWGGDFGSWLGPPPTRKQRYKAIDGMATLVERLAEGIETVRAEVTRLRPRAGGWAFDTSRGEVVQGSAAILTPPLPQSLNVLDRSGIHLPASLAGLRDVRYDMCLSLMMPFEGTETPTMPPGGRVPATAA